MIGRIMLLDSQNGLMKMIGDGDYALPQATGKSKHLSV